MSAATSRVIFRDILRNRHDKKINYIFKRITRRFLVKTPNLSIVFGDLRIIF